MTVRGTFPLSVDERFVHSVGADVDKLLRDALERRPDLRGELIDRLLGTVADLRRLPGWRGLKGAINTRMQPGGIE